MNPNNKPGASGPVMDVQRPRPIIVPTDSPMSPADNIVNQTTDPMPPTSRPPRPRRTGLIVAIITGVVILLIGAGVAGFILYTNRDKPTPTATDDTSQSERVNVEEIDNTLTGIDQTLNTLNDSSDVTPGDVSDSSLGL